MQRSYFDFTSKLMIPHFILPETNRRKDGDFHLPCKHIGRRTCSEFMAIGLFSANFKAVSCYVE
jgi:hypothetical protein